MHLCSWRLAVRFVFFGSLSLPIFAQVNLGRIDGTITDQSGAAIVGATVTVTDVQRGVARTLTSDSVGAYSAPNLIPGTYSVHAEDPGFMSVDRRDIVVEVGQDIRVDISLQPGQQTQTVTVTGEPPPVNTTNAQLGGEITSQTATDLPVAGRTFLFLLNYQPGILTKPGAGGGIIQYTNGLRPEYNVYVFDGLADTNSYGAAGPLNIGFIAGGPDESVILTLDAVQDFNLVENPKAEYGWRPGGQVNIGLKSGTNQLHGTAFALGRDTGLDTRNPFFSAPAPTEFENYGATVGGPIKKDTLFFYAGYEGQNYNVGNPRTLIVPTTASLGGGVAGRTNSLPDAAADLLNNHGFTPAQLSVGLNLAGCAVTGAGAPYAVMCTPGKGLFTNSLATTSFPTDYPDIGGTNNGVAKLDYHLNDKNNLNLDFFRGLGTVVAPVSNVTQTYWSSPLLGSVTVARAVWAWIPNSRWVNEVRAGSDYSLQKANPSPDCSANSGAPNYASLGFISGAQVCGFPAVVISGFGSATAPTLGQPQGISDKSLNYRFSDNVSYARGSHLLKFGAEYARQIFVGETSVNLSKGSISFGTPGPSAFSGATPLEDFLAMVPSSESLQIGGLLRTVYYNQFAFYAQDDWRLARGLTLNLGLRYEYATTIREKNNQLGNFDPASPSGLIQANGGGLYRGYPWDFGPRVGLAWDIGAKGTTVIHTGFDVMYDLYPAQVFMPLNNATQPGLQNIPTGWNMVGPNGIVTTPGGNIALGQVTVSSPAPIMPNTPVFASLTAPGITGSCTTAAPCKIGGVYPRLVTPQFFLWNFGVQHAFTNSLTLDVSYVGNHGQHELDFTDLNQPAPGAAGAAAENARRPYVSQFPWFSNIDVVQAFQYSNYDGLQATLKQRFSHGVNFTAGYTYSHSLEDNIGDVNMTVPQNSLNPNLEYGNGIQDVRHRFTLQGSYAIPGANAPLQMLKGWQISSATQLWSPLPYSPVDPTDDVTGTGEGQDRWDLIGKASDFNGYGGYAAIPCYGAPGSTFANAAGCNVGLPPACVAAASSLPTNPNVPASTPGATGLSQLNRLGCYMSGNSVIVPPAQGTFGTMSRYELRGKGFSEWDISIMKNWIIKERVTTQFRAEIFNVLNMTQFAPLSSTNGANLAQPGKFGATTGTPNIVGQSPIIGNGDTRRIQLGLRFQF